MSRLCLDQHALAVCMAKQGITQKILADRMGIRHSTVGEIISPCKMVNPSTVYRLANALGVPVELIVKKEKKYETYHRKSK